MKQFKQAQARNQAAIKKHLAKAKTPSDSSSEDENEKNEEALQEAVSKVLSSYEYEGGDTEKSLSYLTDIFQSGGAICLICISSVKNADAIWNCSICYSFMHLPCIGQWIRDSLIYKKEKGIIPLWACPKCRTEYPENEIPKKYVCFCGRTIDPPYQPWGIPHSCGERCDKALQPACGHRCLLLCHPGPCPPCPKTVVVRCYCEGEPPRPRRCNAKEWSCGNVCGKRLANCEHLCREICHSTTTGCPPCSVVLSASCRCGYRTEDRVCDTAKWSCEKICGKSLSCKVHVCEGRCHRPGDCGQCPLDKNRTCPCGKKRYRDVTCGQKHVPTCGDTCGKLLNCGSHYCNMRCHPDRCGPCLEVVTKSCRCRSYEKEIACAKEFHCNKKCTQMRTCGNHLCNKKCCDCLLRGNYNDCEKVCDSTLNCQKHKCTAPCHSGPCYPCTRTNVVQCRCGNSKITVPCARTKRIKPPNCNKLCKIPTDCHHAKRESHKCHWGACPPCRKICGLVRKQCAHSCTAICHARVWVKVGQERASNGTIASRIHPEPLASKDETRMRLKTLPCPPCEVSVMTTCLGGHETIPLPCHSAISASCQRPCGRMLGCTHHYCQMPCHLNSENGDNSGNCQECELPCALPRPEGCSHPCPRFCHKGECYPCKQLVKVSCHCGINSLYKRCVQLTELSSLRDEKFQEFLTCGNRCPKNYPCGHRCVKNCHPGECPDADGCSKRVKVWCPCKRIKKDLACTELRGGKVRVECDGTCRRLKEEREAIIEKERIRKLKEEEARDRIEVERFERKFKPRRRCKERTRSSDETMRDTSRLLKKIGLLLGIPLIAFAWVVFYTNAQDS